VLDLTVNGSFQRFLEAMTLLRRAVE
jgi:hypothetical protein